MPSKEKLERLNIEEVSIPLTAINDLKNRYKYIISYFWCDSNVHIIKNMLNTNRHFLLVFFFSPLNLYNTFVN